MFKKTMVAYIFLISLSMIAVVSCNLANTDCGSFSDKFKTVDFQVGLKNITISENPGTNIQYSMLESDTIEFYTFGISMFPIGEYYSLNLEKPKSYSLIPSAFACSPPVPVSEEMITGIEVFSNINFNSEYTSGESITELFEIAVLYRGSGYIRTNIDDFLSSEPNVPDLIFLLLKSAPETTEPIQFTVKYGQNGFIMDSFEFTTPAIVITN